MDEHTPVKYRVHDNIGTIEFDQPDSKVNLLTSTAMQALDKILDNIRSAPMPKAILVTSTKKDVFIAGADIKEIEGIKEREEGEKKSRSGQAILDKLEDLKIPTVAVIDGVALGGGCELVLACRYRISTFNEKVKIGLPEVNLGIIPGFGGTYRLPRLLGLAQGLKMILAGKIISSVDALKFGLVDKLYPQAGLEANVLKFVEEILHAGKGKKNIQNKKLPLPQVLLERTFVGRKILFSETRKTVLKTTKGFYPAPLKAVDVIEKMQDISRGAAMAIEARAFGELAVTDVSKNLVKVFYLSEKYRKLSPTEVQGTTPLVINKCGVLGAGVMGGGIAQLLSHKGVQVRLKDINYDAIAKGFQAAYKIYQKLVKTKRMKEFEVLVKMSNITGTLDYSGFKNLDMIIEAIVENMDVKRKVFKELSDVASARTVLCTNTSALCVTEMAKQTKDPSRVVGLHFFNPVNRMPLIEIIKTDMTSKEAIATALDFTKRLGKIPIIVKDSCGFLVNRILLGYVNEAGRILEEGEKIEVIDEVMTQFGMPMGPFTLSDEVGLDVGYKVLCILEAGLGERFKPVEVFKKVYEKKMFGRKSKRGFYIYGKKTMPNPEIYKMLSSGRKTDAQKSEYRRRMLYLMVNEAAKCLEENIIDEPAAVDVGMIMGTGFPPFLGGLLRFADHIGVDHIVEDLYRLEEKFQSPRFKPCGYLINLKQKNSKFYAND